LAAKFEVPGTTQKLPLAGRGERKMSYTPENSAIKVDRNLKSRLEDMTSIEAIKDALREASLNQGLTVPDAYNSSILHPTALAAAAPKRVGKTITVGGVKHILTARARRICANRRTPSTSRA
jgi:hypothetical protein